MTDLTEPVYKTQVRALSVKSMSQDYLGRAQGALRRVDIWGGRNAGHFTRTKELLCDV